MTNEEDLRRGAGPLYNNESDDFTAEIDTGTLRWAVCEIERLRAALDAISTSTYEPATAHIANAALSPEPTMPDHDPLAVDFAGWLAWWDRDPLGTDLLQGMMVLFGQMRAAHAAGYEVRPKADPRAEVTDGLASLIGSILRKYGGTMKGRGDHDIFDALVRYRDVLTAARAEVRPKLTVERAALDDAYAAMDRACRWAAGETAGVQTVEDAARHMKGYDDLLAATVRAGKALGYLHDIGGADE